MTHRFRHAGPADIPALHSLIERAYRGDAARTGWTHEADLLGGQRTDAAALGEILGDPGQRLLVAEDDRGLVGCVTVQGKGPDAAYLGMLTVHPDRQATGLGRALIAAAEALARETFGATRIEMTVIRQRGELIAYYARRGYAPTGERRPFPHGDPRFGLPKTDALEFIVLARDIG
jgi:GNAT superfamily N-acetyltransferase